MEQVILLRSKVGEMIYNLEREEAGCRRSSKSDARESMRSYKSRRSVRLKTMQDLAKRKIECEYAKAETERKLAMKIRECELVELQREKEFQLAKAQAEMIMRLEKEGGLEFADCKASVSDEVKEERVLDYLASLKSSEPNVPKPVAEKTIPPNELENCSSGSVKLTVQGGQGTRVPEVEKLLTPDATSFKPHGTSTSEPNDQTQAVTEIVAKCMIAARMPLPKLKNFSGDPLDWPLWKATFDTVIEKRTLNDHEKVLYLLKYLSGKPRKVIEGYKFM